jgi:hypothetical protein
MKDWEIIADNLSKTRLLLLAFEESDIFGRATGINRNAGKLPTVHSLFASLSRSVGLGAQIIWYSH